MISNAPSFYEKLLNIATHDALKPEAHYLELKGLLAELCWYYSRNKGVQFLSQGLYGRILYLGNKAGLEARTIRDLQGVRKLGNEIQYQGKQIEAKLAKEAGWQILGFISALSNTDAPEELLEHYPPSEFSYQWKQKPAKFHPEMRVILKEIFPKEKYLACYWEELDQGDFILVAYDQPGRNQAFHSSIPGFWPSASIQLVNVLLEDQVYFPQYLILDPDYLTDVSTLAECIGFKGYLPPVYFMWKFNQRAANSAILLGNIANYFLDQLIQDPEADFKTLFGKTFGLYPIEFTINEELKQVYTFKQFIAKAQWHYQNIKRALESLMEEEQQIYIEPSFLSPRFGLQGRLDLLQIQAEKGAGTIIELKSSKSVPSSGTWGNHQAQAALYQLLVQKVEKLEKAISLILYSGVDKSDEPLRLVESPVRQLQQYLNLRNLAVSNEFRLASAQNLKEIESCFQDLNPGRWESMMPPYKISDLRAIYQLAMYGPKIDSEYQEVLRQYFLYFCNFLAAEWRLAKLGTERPGEGRRGHASLWRSMPEEKGYEILSQLQIIQQKGRKIILEIPGQVDMFNFRKGDAIVLYPWLSASSNIENSQFFKGRIDEIGPDSIQLVLRHIQHKEAVFDQFKEWNVEYDFFDSGYTMMFQSLYRFMQANHSHCRELVMGLQEPEMGAPYAFTVEADEKLNAAHGHIQVLEAALSAKDYYLLMGPPGTGKTSIILKNLVRQLEKDRKKILLLAYTNRAVDEICEVIEPLDYIRIGSGTATSSKYQKRLLDRQLAHCKNRQAVAETLLSHSIYVATVASMNRFVSLFELVDFDLAIIDEASQILEPQIVGLLSLLPKFIMIGDHKQLPAVVQLEPSDTQIPEAGPLQEVGLKDRRNSLFERLYRRCEQMDWRHAIGMLTHQGRMHEAIAHFPSNQFYDGKLKAAVTARQTAPLPFEWQGEAHSLEQKIAQNRLLFFNSLPEKGKRNLGEAKQVAKILSAIAKLYHENDRPLNPKAQIGIITPYRDQIATIREELSQLEIPEWSIDPQDILVDTVERFQGSQKDIIIISFSVNQAFQLEMLSDPGSEVDRKLNVALTRAREQLILIGAGEVLKLDPVYRRLIVFVEGE